MGHERVGALPPTRRWRDIVGEIAPASRSEEAAEKLAARTLKNVRSRFDRVHEDVGVQAAFGFLVALATPSKQTGHGVASVDPRLHTDPSALSLVRDMQRWVRGHRGSMEYGALAEKAAGDVISHWVRERKRQQTLLSVQETAEAIWSDASSGAGFCELARIFFAKFTERYLDYFLGREASAEVSSVKERQELKRLLSDHIDEVSRHAFQISKITESFAAGWFNKRAREQRPSDSEIRGFLFVAFSKIREELLRESFAA